MFKVTVEYPVYRTVYVDAETATEAKAQARDIENWIDAEPVDGEVQGAKIKSVQAARV